MRGRAAAEGEATARRFARGRAGGVPALSQKVIRSCQPDRSKARGSRRLFPLGRAHLTGVLAPVLGGLDLADEFGSVAAHALGSDFDQLDHTVRIDDERATVGQTDAGAQVVEIVGQRVVLVTDEVVGDRANRGRAVGPGLVAEVRVGRDAEHLDAHALQLGIVVLKVFELGRADEGEVGRIEEEHGPLAGDVGLGDVDELAFLVGGVGEGLDRGVDQGHASRFLVIADRDGLHEWRVRFSANGRALLMINPDQID